MALIQCAGCAGPVSEQASTCPHCGHPIRSSASSPSTEGHLSVVAQVVALIGGGLMAAGPLLPWVTMGLLSASGMQKTGDEAVIVVVLGVAGALGPLASLTQRRDVAGWAPVVTGLFGGALTFFYYDQLQTQLADNELVQTGIGVYLTFLGAGLLVLGAALRTKPPNQANGPGAALSSPPLGPPCGFCGTGVGIGHVDGRPICAACWERSNAQ